jgi:hypothetical protein
MTFLTDQLNPVPENPSPSDQYQFDNGVNTYLTSLIYISNPSLTTNANFNTLGTHGTTAVTQANGDDADFSSNWHVKGATVATYSLTSTVYPTGLISGGSPSLIQSSSAYYEHAVVSTYTSGDFYFYQRDMNSIRRYQKNYLTYGILIYNNQDTAKKINMEIYYFYDPSGDIIADNTIYLQPGLNKITSQLKIPSLSGKTIGSGNYTEFRLRFLDLLDGTADLNIYQIKCEFGTVSTLLS